MALILALLASGAAGAQTRVRVTGAVDLLSNIGSNRELVLAAGTYDLSEAAEIRTRAVSWREVFDGRELVVSGLRGLRIRGEGRVTILARPRYAFVLAFEDCADLSLENLVLGHGEGGTCTGGVLSLLRAERVVVRDCELYGSGTVGVAIEASRDFTLGDSKIYGCTDGALAAGDSRSIDLISSEIHDNGAEPLFAFRNTTGVRFADCLVSGNSGSTVFSLDGRSSVDGLAGCVFESNRVEAFAGGPQPRLDGARFDGNSFPDPGSGRGEEGEFSGGEGPAFEVPAAGLRLRLPVGWRFQVFEEGREGATFESLDHAVFGFLLPLTEQAGPDASAAARAEAFRAAAAAFRGKLAANLGIELPLQEQDGPFEAAGFLRQAYAGRVRRDQRTLLAEVQLLRSGGRIQALAVFAEELAAEDYRGEFEFIFRAIERME